MSNIQEIIAWLVPIGFIAGGFLMGLLVNKFVLSRVALAAERTNWTGDEIGYWLNSVLLPIDKVVQRLSCHAILSACQSVPPSGPILTNLRSPSLIARLDLLAKKANRRSLPMRNKAIRLERKLLQSRRRSEGLYFMLFMIYKH